MKTKIIFAKSALMITFVGVAVFTQIQPLHAQEAENASGRERLLLDFGWRFKLADPDGVGKLFDYPEVFDLAKCRKNDEELEAKLVPQRVDAAKVNLGADVSYVKADFDDGNWRMLNIPHDWTVELGFDQKADKDHGYRAMAPELGTTIGWYRRTFDLPESDKGKALWLEFDGVFRNCLVWLNGKCLGRHLSGYSSFKYDISNIANYGGSNTLVVRVDATRTEGWFYEGAGIYRHVWLVKTPPLHVAHWGTFVVSTPKDKDAQVTVETTVRNDSAQTATGKLVSTILDAEGKQVGQAVEDAITVEPGNEKILKQNIDLKDVTLWSLENPYLYKLVSRVEQKSSPADVYDTTFGIRTVAFDCDKGFFLNGKQIYIKGTCNHQDHAGVGVALPDRLQSYRLEKLKEFGCNAYRSSHNPPTPELLDACDRMGILVLDEQRRMGTTPEILDQLKRLMLRDRNHPCIFLWALGNEEWDIQGIDKGGEVTRKMKEVANQLDPSRLKTVPMSGGWGSSMSEVVDVQGCNYFHNGDYDAFRKQFPKKPILGTEEGSTTTTRGVYENNKEKGHLAAYDDNAPSWASTAELWWKFYMERPWIGGVFVWTGFDYRGEPTPLLWPCISSHFGIMDTCGFPKDNYYFYKSWWTDETVLHLLPHWNWPGKEGRDIDVRCFSNCDEVELFLNGQSLGKKPMPRNSHLAWRVKYEPGTLGAKGYKNGKVIAEEKVETTGAPAAIKLTPDRTEINADGEDIAIVNVAVLDAQGRVVPVADNEVRFQAWGNARIIGVGNGDPSSYEPDKAAKRKAFNGLCQFIVQSTRQPGSIELKAISPELQSDRVLIESKPARPRPAIIPAGWESPIIAVMSPPADAPKIRLNTIGYLPDREKKATVAEKCSIFAVVRVKDGAKVFEGTVTGPVLNEDTREQLYTADFSALKEPGEYRLDVPDVGQSAPFRVTVDVFNQAYYTVMRAMYMWRCGTAVKGTYNGITFSHEACHTNDAWLDAVTGKHEKKDSTKGWHDAGDYNKYTINAAVTVGTMLRAWEDFGPRIQKISLDIPETGGKLPDFLAEIKWELDWLLKMQAPDGSVYHKISARYFCGFILPEEEKEDRFFTPWGSPATADFVAITAMASRAFRPFDAEYADRLLEAAKKSYQFLKAHPENHNPDQKGFRTGGYDTTDPDDRLWAAAELWESTGDTQVLKDLETRIYSVGGNFALDWDWPEVKNLGLYTYVFSKRPGRDETLVAKVRDNLISSADEIVKIRNKHGYGRPLGTLYYWSCNGGVARQTLNLYAAYRLSPKPEYLETALDSINHLFGRNCYGRSFVTGLGDRPPMHPHDRVSGGDKVVDPWPGYLVGGSHPGATNWQDVEEDFRTNEIAINWNAALIYALAAFVDAQGQ